MRSYLAGFGFGFIKCVDELDVVQHVARGRGELSEKRVLQVLEQTFVSARLLDQTLPLFLQLLSLEGHDDTQQLVLQTL